VPLLVWLKSKNMIACCFNRERVARLYHGFFSKYKQFELPPLEDKNRKSCFHLYALRLINCTEVQRDSIIEEITQKGVAVNVHFIPVPM
jgi:dTDP-4-amino-4,6-dideoxygalactose transaminase